MGKVGKLINATEEELDLHREKLVFQLQTVTEILERHDINYFIAYGTLLGLYRDGELLRYDNDVDICINAATLTLAFVEEIKPILQYQMPEMFFSYEEIVSALKGEKQFDLKCLRVSAKDKTKRLNGISTDLYMFYNYGGDMYSAYCKTCYTRIRVKSFNTVLLETKYGTFRVPKDINQFFVDEYGLSWRCPDPNYTNMKFGYHRTRRVDVGSIVYDFVEKRVINKHIH
jgi:hypothetical protein